MFHFLGGRVSRCDTVELQNDFCKSSVFYSDFVVSVWNFSNISIFNFTINRMQLFRHISKSYSSLDTYVSYVSRR